MRKILVQALKRKVDICKANTNQKKQILFSVILYSALLFYLVTDSIQCLLKNLLLSCNNIKFQMEGMHHLSYFLQRESFQISKLNFTMLNIFRWGKILQWAIKKLVIEHSLAQHAQSSGCHHLHNRKKKYTPQLLNISIQADAPTILCPSISV